jgi:solute carrier family 30 (zinc transporter), member 1
MIRNRLHFPMPHLTTKNRLCIVIGISFSFFIAEIAIGFKTRSLALVADAFHYLTDLVGFIVALIALHISQRGRSPQGFSFGWQRAQLLGAFFNGVFLAALGMSIFLQAVERFVSIERVEDPKLVLIVGGVGLGLNILSAAFLGHDHGHGGHDHGHGGHDHGHGGHDHGHGLGHGHAHSHNHGETSGSEPTSPTLASASAAEAARMSFQVATRGVHATHRHTTNATTAASGRDLGMLGVLLHVIGDAINNIGVMISAIAIWFGKTEGRFYADPAVSLGISFMILATSIPLMKNSGRILLQSGPAGVDISEVKADLQQIPGVLSIHELHIWRLNQQKTVATAHLVTDDDSLEGFSERAKLIGECLHAYGVHSYTIQPELKTSSNSAASEDHGAASGHATTSAEPTQEPSEAPRRESIRLKALRKRGSPEGYCALKCEQESCKELQCCDG